MDRLGGAFDSFDGHDHFDDFVDDESATSNPPPSPVGQDERRMQVRAYNHWASLLGNKRFPLIEDLEPEFLGDFGPHSVLLDFSTGSSTPTIQFIGDALSKECGLYEAIEELNEVPEASLLSQVADNYLKILAEQAPTGFEAEFVNAKGATVLYRGILLPYSSDSDTIDFVYAVINWKEVADAGTADALMQQIDEALDTANQQLSQAPNPTPLRKRNPLQLSDPDPIIEEPVIEPVAFEEVEAGPAPAPSLGGKGRAVDALGNPIGGAPADEGEDEPEQGYSGPMTAADYGLPEWDEDEYEDDDVDEVINPLADIDLNSRLLSLVNPQARVKKSLDLHGNEQAAGDQEDAPEAEERGEIDATYFAAEETSDDPAEETVDFAEPVEFAEEPEAEAVEEFAAEEPEAVEEPAVEQPEDELVAAEEVAFEEEPEEPEVLEAVEPVEAYAEVEHDEAFDEEPLELVDEIVPEELEAEAQDEPVVDVEPEPEIVLEAPEVQDVVEEEAVQDEPEIVLEAPEPVETFEEDAPEAIEDDVLELAEADVVAEPEAEAEADFEVEAVAEVYAEPDFSAVAEEAVEAGEPVEAAAPAPITASELEDSLAVANHLANSEAADDAETRKALYEAVRLAYDLANYLRDEGNPAVTQDASESIDALAGRLRELEGRTLYDLSVRGPEFALVMVRRGPNGELTVLGEVPEEQALIGSAARKLLSK
ncbi:hypothetical protein K3165_08190 [Qipengyuania sp. 1XM1-15A]|uniref:hypothetical protein n=1 Tax=Qipengyuania xiamenensis TaxID=2867237 RepID=UPI001C86C722|nr:hypothetical protein [Qipengyuania xiamenensis]MBX7532898.1 hypothetical protein [Qipengyuania xiamenensis]